MPKHVGRAFILLMAGCLQLSHAADADRRIFGPLRFGMSLDQARAALPDAHWTVTDQHYETHRPYAIKADNAVMLAGVGFDVTIGSRYLGATDWELESDLAGSSAAACHERIVPVVVELGRRFGRFHHLGEVIDGEALVQVGTASDAKISFAERTRQLDPKKAFRRNQEYWFVARHDVSDEAGDLAIDAKAHYEPNRNRSCLLTIELVSHEAPPAQLQAFDETRVIARPTIAYRNGSLRAIGVPAKPLKFVVPCRIFAATGRIGACVSGPTGAPIDPYRKLASEWALRFQLKVDDSQPDDQRLFDIEVPVTLGPDDVRTVDVSTGHVLDQRQLIVTRGAKIDGDDFYPKEMLPSRATADIAILCKVQEDGSMLCALKPGTTSPAQAFTDVAIQLGERLEVKTQLRDGTSAIGGLIERKVKFVPPADDSKKH